MRKRKVGEFAERESTIQTLKKCLSASIPSSGIDDGILWHAPVNPAPLLGLTPVKLTGVETWNLLMQSATGQHCEKKGTALYARSRNSTKV
jgi:hypothetical protein